MLWASAPTSVALTAHMVVPDRGADEARRLHHDQTSKRALPPNNATLQLERDVRNTCEAEALERLALLDMRAAACFGDRRQ